MKTSKIKEIRSVNSYESKYGTFYAHEILMENWDAWQLSKKTEGSIKVGDELNYTITENEYGFKIKEVRDFPTNQQWGKKKGWNASFALSYAKDLVVAGKTDVGTILEQATKFKEWLDNN